MEDNKQPEALAQMAANAVLGYLKECGLHSQEAEEWIKKVFELVRAKL